MAIRLWVLIVITFALSYLPFVRVLGVELLRPSIVIASAIITLRYVTPVEMTKSWLYGHKRPVPQFV